MEDIAVGIFRTIIIAILIISVVSRNKRQRAARHGSGSDNSPAEMPWDMPHRDRTSTPVPPAANQTPAPPAVQPRMPQPQQAKRIVTEPVVAKSRTQPVKAVPDEAEAMAAEYYRTRGAYRPAVSAESVATQRPSEPASVAETAEKDDITARFNLRDAVLYSEILRPKFDE